MLAHSTPNAALHNIPIQVTSFIGREREIADVKRLLATSHLLTLTGAGGCGKTRLAFQVAADAASAYPDGVWLAELAALTDPGLVPQAVASAVGVREAPGFSVTDTLVDYLRSRALLLVLDNGEHVVGNAAQLVDALLRRCSGVRILATSREPLGSPGETTWRVPSLGVPPQPTVGELSPEQLREYEAIVVRDERRGGAIASPPSAAPQRAELAGKGTQRRWRRRPAELRPVELGLLHVGFHSGQELTSDQTCQTRSGVAEVSSEADALTSQE